MKRTATTLPALLLALACLALSSEVAVGQTMPAPQDLPYAQDFSSLDHASVEYPEGWQGWYFGNQGGIRNTYLVGEPSADAPLRAPSGASSNAGGVHNYGGSLGLLGSTNSASGNPSLTLAINTTGESNVGVSYEAKVVRVQGRTNAIALQYRVGEEGDFTTLEETEYLSHVDGGPNVPETIQVTLPSEADDQPVVQLRWVIRDFTSNGNRSSLAISDIVVGDIESPTPTVQFAEESDEVGEDAGSYEIEVTLSNDPEEGTVSVDVVFDENASTATSADIGGFTTETVTLSATERTKTVTVTIVDNDVVDGDRDAVFRLENATGDAQIGTQSTFTLTIVDDEVPQVPGIIAYWAFNDGGENPAAWPPPIGVDIGSGFITHTFGVEGNRGHASFGGTTINAQEGYGDGGSFVPEGSHNDGESFTLSFSTVGYEDVVISYATQRTGTGFTEQAFEYSIDGGETFDSLATITNIPSSWGVRQVALPAAAGNQENVLVKVTLDGATTGSGNNRFDNLLVTSSSTVVADDNAGWRMLAPPSGGMTVQNLANQNLVQGISDEYPEAAANIYVGYDGSGFAKPSGKGTELEPGRGFIWYLYDVDHDPPETTGESQSRAFPFTLWSSGPVLEGDVTVSGLNASDVADGWNLLGNPFDEAIDLDQLQFPEGGGLAALVGHVWDPNAGASGSYQMTTDAEDSEAPNVLGVWQGAFFENDDATSVTFPASARLGTGGPFYGRGAEAAEVRRVGFEVESESTLDRALVLYFSEGGGEGWDLWDATKLTPLSSTYATLAFVGERGGREVLKAQESRALEPGSFSVPLAFEAAGASGPYTLRWPRWHNIPETWTLEIEDLVTGQVVDLREAESLVFSASATRPAQDVEAPRLEPLARSAEARLVLHVTASRIDAEEAGASPEAFALGAVFPNPLSGRATVSFALPEAAEVRLAVYDLLGREVAVLAEGPLEAGRHRASWAAEGLAAGVYVLRLTAGSHVGSVKAVVAR